MPQSRAGSFLGRPLGRKLAGQMVSWHQGGGGDGESSFCVRGTLCREPRLQDRLASGVGNFPNSLPWNSEL